MELSLAMLRISSKIDLSSSAVDAFAARMVGVASRDVISQNLFASPRKTATSFTSLFELLNLFEGRP